MQDSGFKYAPDWTIWSSKFQNFSGEGLTEPPPQTPPRSFSGFALDSGFARFGPPQLLKRGGAPGCHCFYLTVTQFLFISSFGFQLLSSRWNSDCEISFSWTKIIIKNIFKCIFCGISEMQTGPGSTCDSTFKAPRVSSFAEINSVRSYQEDNAYGSYKTDSPFHPYKEEINHSNSSRISSDDDAKSNALDSYDETFPPLAAAVQSSSSSTPSRASKSSLNPTSFSLLASSLLKDTLVHGSISESSVIPPDLNNRQNMERYRSSASNTPVMGSSPAKSTNVEVKKKFGTKKAIPSKDSGDATSRFGEILVCTNCSESSHRAKDCPMKSTIKFYWIGWIAEISK